MCTSRPVIAEKLDDAIDRFNSHGFNSDLGRRAPFSVIVSRCEGQMVSANRGRLGPPNEFMEEVMDWNRVQGSWKQLEGNVKAKWGMLTDDDLTAINGRREELEGKIQQRYGIAKDQARKPIDEWLSSQS